MLSDPATIRALGERAIATFKGWKVLNELRCRPAEPPRSCRPSSSSKPPRTPAAHDEKGGRRAPGRHPPHHQRPAETRCPERRVPGWAARLADPPASDALLRRSRPLGRLNWRTRPCWVHRRRGTCHARAWRRWRSARPGWFSPQHCVPAEPARSFAAYAALLESRRPPVVAGPSDGRRRRPLVRTSWRPSGQSHARPRSAAHRRSAGSDRGGRTRRSSPPAAS